MKRKASPIPAPTPACAARGCGPAILPRGDADHQLAVLAKALGHPARVRIVRLLIARDACICGDIVAEVALAQSTVSQHLAVLKQAGLIQGTIDGPSICYCANPLAVTRLRELIGALAVQPSVASDR